jgi:lactaldehyde reductase
MMLPIVMEFNAEYTGEKFKNIAEALGVDTTGMDQAAYRKAAIDAVRQLSVDVGIPTKLEKLKEEDLDFLAQSAAADVCEPGNPRRASIEEFKDMFRKLM